MNSECGLFTERIEQQPIPRFDDKREFYRHRPIVANSFLKSRQCYRLQPFLGSEIGALAGEIMMFFPEWTG
jgi:hypothetical protein